jgi:erythromycin esterase
VGALPVIRATGFLARLKPAQAQRGRGRSTRRELPILAVALSCAVPPAAQRTGGEPNQEPVVADSVAHWLTSQAIRLRTVEAGNGFADMQPLREVVGDARIVALGEPTHGNREIFQLKHRILEFLVREMGFNIFALEAPLPESFDINEYILNGTGDPANALAGITMWTWDTEEVLAVIEWMRSYNADPANTRKLKFYGFDMQAPERAARVTLDYLDRVDPALAETARERLGSLAVPFTDPDAFGWRPVIDSEADSAAARTIRNVLATLDGRREAHIGQSGHEAWAFARHHAHVLAGWIEANRDRGRAYGAVRDLTMAENVRWILEREGGAAKVVLWGHNVHVSNAPASHRPDSSDWAGRHLRRMYGNDLVIFGVLFDRGGFRAVEAMPVGALRDFRVGPAPGGTVEAVLAAAGLKVAVIDLRPLPPTGAVAEWFGVPRATRNSWGDYSESARDDYFLNYLLPEAFDALLFVDWTTPVRTLNPADYEALPVLASPANLDFETSRDGGAPEDWLAWSKLRRLGYEVVTSADRPYRGSRSAMLRREPGQYPGEASGSVLQRIDASPFRGRRIRLRAAARADVSDEDGFAFLRLQIQPAPAPDAHGVPGGIFDTLDEHRVDSAGWRVYEIVADVPEHAGVISYGLFLTGVGTAWLDDVTVEGLDGAATMPRTGSAGAAIRPSSAQLTAERSAAEATGAGRCAVMESTRKLSS